MTISKSTVILSLGLIAVAVGGGYAFWLFTRPPVDTTVAVVAPPAPAIVKVKKKVIKPKQVIVYAEEAKAKLKLPPLVIANPDNQVLSATTIPSSERKVTVTSVLDEKTGETTMYSKPEPFPWLAVESRGDVSFAYGYKLSRGQPVPVPVGRLSIHHNFVQVKAIHVGVTAAIDTDASAFVGIGLAYRW